jgi:hypothetical protein
MAGKLDTHFWRVMMGEGPGLEAHAPAGSEEGKHWSLGSHRSWPPAADGSLQPGSLHGSLIAHPWAQPHGALASYMVGGP